MVSARVSQCYTDKRGEHNKKKLKYKRRKIFLVIYRNFFIGCKECAPAIKILIAANSKVINDAKGEFKCSRDPSWHLIAVIKFYVHPFLPFTTPLCHFHCNISIIRVRTASSAVAAEDVCGDVKKQMLLLLLSRVKRQVQKYSNEKRLPATILCTLISPLLPPLIESVIARALRGMRHASTTHTHNTPCLYKINGRRARALVHFFQLEHTELIEIATWPRANLRFSHSVSACAEKRLVRLL
jgi:hypothetical protein